MNARRIVQGGSLRVPLPTPTIKSRREGMSMKSWHESCYVTSRFLLDKGSEQYFREY